MRTVIPIKQVETREFGKDAGGWERMSTLAEPRLSEMAENYRTLGFEVEVRDMPRCEGDCNACFEAGSAIGQVFGPLFIRRTSAARQDNELFD